MKIDQMKRYPLAAILLAWSALASGSSAARATLQASEPDVDLGQFKVGQERHGLITISNAGRGDVALHEVLASCSCLRCSIDRDVVAPGRPANLKVVIERQYPGPFSYFVMVIPRDTNEVEPLKIPVRGEAVCSVSSEVGWRGGIVPSVTYPAATALGLRHQSSAQPVVTLTTLDGSNLQDSIADVNSVHFCLDAVNHTLTSCRSDRKSADRQCNRLTMTLKPKHPLELGHLRDVLQINLRDGSKLYIPIVCRIVGDAYMEEDVIHLGRLADSPERILRVLFADKAKRWSAVHWEGSGLLSEALVVQDADPDGSGDRRLVVTVDQAKAKQLPRGYLFSRMRLFGDSDDMGLTAFIDAFN